MMEFFSFVVRTGDSRARPASLGIACRVLAVILLGATAYSQQDVSLAVQSLSDTLAVGSGVKVVMIQGSTARAGITGVDGFTRGFPGFTTDVPITISLSEKSTASGRLLGQRLERTIARGTPGCGIAAMVHVFQPLLVPVVLDSSEAYTTGGHHGRWGILPYGSGSQYVIGAEVGLLLNDTEVNAYEAYCNVTFDNPGTYRTGIAIRSGNESFGDDGAIIELDCSGHGFTDVPVLESYHVTGNPLHLGQADFACAPVHWDGTILDVRIDGDLGSGTNLVLLRDPGSAPRGGTYPVALLSAAASGPPATPAGRGRDCDPAAAGVHGFGQCIAWWRHYAFHWHTYVVEKPILWIGGSCRDRIETSACLVHPPGLSSSTCDRTSL